MKKCLKCKQWKPKSEFSKNRTRKDGLQDWCTECGREYARTYKYRHGSKPMGKNKECASYLGCYINERILKHVMPNAVLMDNNNPGYDLICGKGYLVDAKSSTLHYPKNGSPRWSFTIYRNKTPDYFLLTAYKDRESLEICHMWLVPGDAINDKVSVTMAVSNIHRLDQYKIDHMDALSCVNEMKK